MIFVLCRKESGLIATVVFNQEKVKNALLLGKNTDAFFLKVLDLAHDCLVLIDMNTRLIIYANEACKKMYGYNQEELFGMPVTTVSAAGEIAWQSYLSKVMQNHPGDYCHQDSHARKSGSFFTVEVISKLVVINKRYYVLCHITDITRQKKMKLQIKKMIHELRCRAYRDYLTGMYNRHYLFDVYLKRLKGQDVGVLVLDIDGFKQINDRYGHQAGDLVLVETARIIGEHIRPGDKVIRFGGDEIMMLLPAISQADISKTAKRIQADIAAREFGYSAGVITCAVSIGMARGRVGNNKQMDDLIRQADADLYRCKRASKMHESQP